MAPDINRARAALSAIPADLAREDWVKVGMAAHAAGLSFDDFNEWSAQASNYDAPAARDTWRSFKPGKGIGPGTLFKIAADHGHKQDREAPPPRKAPTRPAAPRTAAPNAADVWKRCDPATHAHPYVAQKNATGVPLDNLRVVPTCDPLRIAGESMAGALVVPVLRQDGTLASLQFITPPATATRLKASGRPGKLNLPGARLDGWHVVGELRPGGLAFVCEGIGQAWACWQATGHAAVVAFGWGNVAKVAQALARQDGAARLVLVPDAGKEADAAKIAAELGAEFVTMPEGWEPNSDVSDLAKREGMDSLEALLSRPQTPVAAPLPLGIVFAEELPDTYAPPDELVEGVLTAGAGSILYGDSNSGKTFLAIDMACAVARGVPWMGRRTEPGLVVYVAAESPASVRSRLQAYQTHHRCKVPRFAIVQAPVNLYQCDADTEQLILAVKAVEKHTGQRAALVIGDTLARLSAGANENSGEDMGIVVRRFDRIRAETGAHFLLIHHSGKDAAKGARGHSSLRAAVDTEIEVTDAPQGRCAEITKQRDLPTKGDRIGFSLELVPMGVTKWGKPATTCVVTPTDAPAKAAKGKRVGEVEGAVVEFLAQRKTGARKAEVVAHFGGRYERANVYRAMRSLTEARAIHEAAGMVCIAEAAR